MKFMTVVEYVPDCSEKLKSIHPAHHNYLKQFLDNGALRAAGPLANDAGALLVLEAKDTAAIDEIVKGDPYATAGLVASWKTRALAYFSAKEAIGS